jgi:hypothetical protein
MRKLLGGFVQALVHRARFPRHQVGLLRHAACPFVERA